MLDQIITHKQAELKAFIDDQRDLVQSLKQHGPCAVIAEYKRASPSAGVINTTLSVEEAVQQYEAGGAAAISILTDQRFFQGQLDYLRRARTACTLPLLRKDFIIDPIQVYESKLAGADAILLIARILPQEQLIALADLAHALHLQILVEINEQSEITKALRCHPDMLGINSRNLQTMTTDLPRIAEIITAIPKEILVVAESGVQSRSDVEKLQQAGARAVLIGTHFMRANNQQTAVAELCL